jgi:hypothetical protein
MSLCADGLGCLVPVIEPEKDAMAMPVVPQWINGGLRIYLIGRVVLSGNCSLDDESGSGVSADHICSF